MRIIEGYENAKAALSRRAGQSALADEEREQYVRNIIKEVRARGDAALYDFTEKFDGVRLKSLEVTQSEVNCAYLDVEKELLSAMELAASRIKAYHEQQKKMLVRDFTRGNLGWLMRPVGRVGMHAPGASAPLPSSLLMTAIPARVAGVKELIMVTPPQKNGRVSPITLAAAKIAGVDRIFAVGGAHAVAALTYGTETIPAVDKVCGPGNIYLTMAKKIVYGDVGIDGLYGPSEVIIIADEMANASYVAADLLAQAEHGAGALSIMVTISQKTADAVNIEVGKQLNKLKRRDIAGEALEKRGFIAIVKSVDEAIELANLYAPEHLCLILKNAASYIKKVNNTGCLFVGENSIEALVDYAAGPSHVLPTEGTARFSSGLNILDFVKVIDLVKTDKTDIQELGKAAVVIAKAEGLDAHAHALEQRLKSGQGGN